MDAGGTSARFGLVNETGEVLFQTSSPTGLDATGDELVNRFRQGVRDALTFAQEQGITLA